MHRHVPLLGGGEILVSLFFQAGDGDFLLRCHFYFFLFILFFFWGLNPGGFLEGGFFGSLLFVKLRLELIQEFYAPGAIRLPIHFIFQFVFL
jgi:hypothetical protein